MIFKCKVLPAVIFALSSSLYSCYSLATEIVNVPDTKFRTCLNDYLHHLPDAPITDTELASLEGQLSCAEMGVADITGAEYLVNVTYLNVEYNQLTSLAPLANLTQLTRLAAGGNHITTGAPLKSLVNMTDLDLNNNSLSDGDFIAEMEPLVSLNLSTNNIRSCPGIEGLKNLKNIYLQGARMTDISNFGGLTQVEQLNLSENGLSDMSVLSRMTSLTFLEIDKQDIQINPVANTGTLTIDNPVKSIDGSLVTPTTISNDGIYENGQIIWSSIPAGTDDVTFDFSQTISVDGLEVPFSGSVTQYLE
ncbi:Ig-like domain-containing protein [Ewingella americana]